MRAYQEPDQHGHEEHYVHGQYADGIGQPSARFQRGTCLRNWVIGRIHLANM
jgi:hypothetical protein